MAGDVVIRAEGLGKKYLIGHQTEARATTLREALGRSARGLARSAGAMMKGRPLVAGDAVEEFWALKDVSFEVKRGEVVGLIGRNGAGKSTLLKILSRITEPTEGRVAIKGRVASLLEVGTGFHPELTGRENIFLNGAILGMTRAEIRRKFDEIVDFAGIEKFLDTPVKRYSSGMYVRLAFAVAAHLEPEILIVDEVLAVGDAEFQNKCLGKMQDVAGHGRTVLFVSHNRAAISRLCPSAMWIQDGRLRLRDETSRVLADYGSSLTAGLSGRQPRLINRPVMLRSIDVIVEGRGPGVIFNTDAIDVIFEIEVREKIRDCRLSVNVCSPSGDIIFVTNPADDNMSIEWDVGVKIVKLTIPKYTFLPRSYVIDAAVWNVFDGVYDRHPFVEFAVEAAKNSRMNVGGKLGQLTIPCIWS